jgi:4-alpha-glucanotransferase
MQSLPRSSGILLHPSSLPGPYGIDEIGPEAHRWLEILATTGQTLWQVLPMGPTGYGNSPYQSLSSFAGNPLLISFDSLRMDGVLKPEDLAMLPSFSDGNIDFNAVMEVRSAFLKLAARRFLTQCQQSPLLRQRYELFCQREESWLHDFAMFMALKEYHHQKPWTEWEHSYILPQGETLATIEIEHHNAMEECKVLQFFFHRQWQKLRVRAKELGITIIGDIPIFTAHDSADVWANQHLFELNPEGQPTVVAGVPPDYFSATGQRWGNPLYKWELHQNEDFEWWRARMSKMMELYDVVRIDHFRGFAAYWEIPASEATAENGRWVESPGDALFNSLKNHLGTLPVIAEDLGIITDDVVALRDRHQLPGMKVMQFAFGVDSLAEDYIPENYPEHSVAYTGTHDNDTVVGLFHSRPGADSTRTAEQIEAERRTILGYTGTDGSEIHWDFIQRVWNSKSAYAIAPLQDVLGLGSEARMNIPGQMGEFWTWRFTWADFQPEFGSRLQRITEDSGRLHPSPQAS